MAVTNDSVELLQQRRIGDWQHLARRCFYIEGEVVRIGGNRTEERRDLLCLCHVGWLCSLPGIAKMRPIQEQVVSFSPGQVRKSDRCSRAFKGKEAITPYSPEAGVDFRYSSPAMLFTGYRQTLST